MYTIGTNGFALTTERAALLVGKTNGHRFAQLWIMQRSGAAEISFSECRWSIVSRTSNRSTARRDLPTAQRGGRRELLLNTVNWRSFSNYICVFIVSFFRHKLSVTWRWHLSDVLSRLAEWLLHASWWMSTLFDEMPRAWSTAVEVSDWSSAHTPNHTNACECLLLPSITLTDCTNYARAYATVLCPSVVCPSSAGGVVVANIFEPERRSGKYCCSQPERWYCKSALIL